AIGVNAVCGVAAVLFGDFQDVGDLEVKAVGSSLSVTAGLLVALACVAALNRASLKPVAAAGIGLSAIGFGLVFAGVWGQWGSTQFWEIAATLIVASVGCAWASLLSRRAIEAFHPMRIASLICVLAFAVTGIAALWAEPRDGDFWRIFGTFGLLLAGAT